MNMTASVCLRSGIPGPWPDRGVFHPIRALKCLFRLRLSNLDCRIFRARSQAVR